MANILLYGNFGKPGALATNGQTIKTMNYERLLIEAFPEHLVSRFNTDGLVRRPLRRFVELRRQLKKNQVAVIFPGSVRSLSFFFSAYSSSKSKASIFYPVVGGWLADGIKHKPSLQKKLRCIERLYPETYGLQKKLAALGIDNTCRIPVFSTKGKPPLEKAIETYRENRIEGALRLVYFGRVTSQKGVYRAIDAVRSLQKTGQVKCFLDLYGKIDEKEDLKTFYGALGDGVEYRGPFDDSSFQALASYDYFVFPTSYPGEGFPACCVESMSLGTPIIASDWKYNGEIVREGQNGFLFSLEGNGLVDAIIRSALPLEEMLALRKRTYLESESYAPKTVISPFLEDVRKALE